MRLEYVMELFGNGRFLFAFSRDDLDWRDVYGTDSCKSAYFLL